ncbi:MAG: hypothetical protein IT374_28370 [Polyangiaceae bacterium]|nr:hypothetical protein [Polyangiaceae bacterium]
MRRGRSYLSVALLTLATLGDAQAGVRVKWEPVGDFDADSGVESLDFEILAVTGPTTRLVGLDWVKPGGYVFSAYQQASVGWKALKTTGGPATLPVEGATVVEGPSQTVVALTPHDVLSKTPAMTWILNGSTWTSQPKTSSDEDRYDAAAAFDADRGVSVVFGGSCPSGAACLTTLEWDGASWKKISAAGPSPRRKAAMAWAKGVGVVMFGGRGEDGAPLADTWVWDGSTWTPRDSAVAPPAREGAELAYDPASGLVALFGGVDVEAPETWVLGGGGWQLATLDSAPPRDKVTGDFYELHDFGFATDPQGGLLVGALGAAEIGTWRARLSLGGAESCTGPADCASGFCADGVCCDAPCAGACDACSVKAGATMDGVCSPRRRGDDGAPSCGAARCDGSSRDCPTSCSSDDDCAPGVRCSAGRCTESECADDLSAKASSGPPTSCAPYRCRAGQCLTTCAAGADCAPGSTCSTAGACTAPPASSDDGGGCDVSDAPSRGPWGALALLGLLLLQRKRRA